MTVSTGLARYKETQDAFRTMQRFVRTMETEWSQKLHVRCLFVCLGLSFVLCCFFYPRGSVFICGLQQNTDHEFNMKLNVLQDKFVTVRYLSQSTRHSLYHCSFSPLLAPEYDFFMFHCCVPFLIFVFLSCCQYIEGPRAQLTDARLYTFETRLRAAEDEHALLQERLNDPLARLLRNVDVRCRSVCLYFRFRVLLRYRWFLSV